MLGLYDENGITRVMIGVRNGQPTVALTSSDGKGELAGAVGISLAASSVVWACEA